ncbi:hypothetical protein RN001_005689 [Aquatica leii]|uniref:Uncharacterized protein n=1 Tax=Aquatica leii TaxID=1421715 RepID=A0AAN7P6W5_9COLE|nr:hypothetical protein RN001_005689 [Aquatica leii]
MDASFKACGDGPTRDIYGWKKVFTEWKSQVRKKARESKPLNVLENRVLTATGKIVVEGIATVPELGSNEVENVINELPNVIVEYEYVESDVSVGHKESITRNDLGICEVPIAAASTSFEKEVQEQHMTNTPKRTKAKASDKLLQAYIKTTDSQKEGLGEVAAGLNEWLNAIAKGIHRLCDILEKQ